MEETVEYKAGSSVSSVFRSINWTVVVCVLIMIAGLLMGMERYNQVNRYEGIESGGYSMFRLDRATGEVYYIQRNGRATKIIVRDE